MQRQLKKGEGKALKDRAKSYSKADGSSSNVASISTSVLPAGTHAPPSLSRKAQKAHDDLDDELFKLAQKRAKIEREHAKDSAKGGRDAEKAARKRNKDMRELEKDEEKARREFDWELGKAERRKGGEKVDGKKGTGKGACCRFIDVTPLVLFVSSHLILSM